MPAAVIAPVRKRQDPRRDPRFKRVNDKLGADAKKLKQHPPAKKKAGEPAKAAKGPPNEKAAGARANQVDKLDQAETPKPETASFLSILQAEIAKVMPKTLGDTEKFMKGGDSSAIKDPLKGNVAQQKGEATGDLKQTSGEAPSETGVPAKPVTPIPPEGATPAPQVNAAAAMPAPATSAQISLEASKDVVAGDMEKNKLTPERLTKANDPRFSSVLTAQDQVNKQATAGPGKYRAAETATLARAAGQAVGVAKKGVGVLLGAKKGSQTKVLSRQEQQKAQEEKELGRFTAFVVKTFENAKKAVDGRLDRLETTVNDMFDRGTDTALASMKTYIENELYNYKLNRYLLRVGGSLLWIKDQIMDLPDEVNRFFEAGRRRFTGAMNALAVQVANVVETELAAAKNEVKTAQAQIAVAQKALSPAVQTRAAEVTADYAGKFQDLETGIEDRKQQLAEGLAQKYKEAFDKAAEVEKGIKDDNKGLVTKAKEKIEAVVKALAEFKDKLMAILRKGADTIELILKDPIQFLSNLISAIKAGFSQFSGNILTHLAAGFAKWLFGALAGAGIAVPSDLTVVSILKMVLSILGITYANMRAKLVKMIGNTAVTVIEKMVEYAQVLLDGGPAKLWEQIKADLATLREMVVDAIQDWIITTVVKRAVAKVLSMFNPAGAIIQAILMIVSVVQFVIERAAQIMEFVESVINSIHSIATGAVGAAAGFIEKSLANMIPILIGFLAALVGLGGLGAKIKGFIDKAKTKVDRAIDKVLQRIAAIFKKLGGVVKAAAKRVLNWWKKKVPVSGGGESHTLTFSGSGKSAALVLRSAPQDPSLFLADAAKKRSIEPATSAPDITKAKGHEKKVKGLQTKLAVYDAPTKATATGTAETDANKLMGELDTELTSLSAHLSTTLGSWGVQDPDVGTISLPRPSFTVEHKTMVAELPHTKHGQLRKSKEGKLINLRKGLARRHVVSSHDMAGHFEKALTKKKCSKAKLLLEQRSSAGGRTAVRALNTPAIQEAAAARHLGFFGYAKNLFVGNSKENSSIQQYLDKGHPEMAEKELRSHITHVKRVWALDDGFEPSEK